jgi:prepilin-type processing-associated H-X9-DG protein
MMPPTSNHPGGVNCGTADGSVTFINETIHVIYTNKMGGPAPPSSLPATVRNAVNKQNAIVSGDAQHYNVYDYSGPSGFGVWGALGSINGGEPVTLP